MHAGGTAGGASMTPEEHREPLSSEVKRLEGEVGTHAHHPLLHLPMFEQLKQRNVFRVAVLYVVVCWLILDPVHVVFHMLEVPTWANRLVVILMAVGFPAVVIFAWVYEITPGGLKPTVEVPHEKSIRKLTGRRLDRAIIAVLAVALAYFVVDKFWISKRFPTAHPAAPAAEATMQRPTVPAAAFAPPPHSIAVLPFVNMSGDKEQEYFSEGLTEELLNSLSRVNELQVAARTSSFSFQGEHPDIATVAHKLNVSAVLEGSVRRYAHTVRITAQLVNARTGFHVWSGTYDRDLGDVLNLQTEIATAVASALKVTLLGDVAGKIALGGTRDPGAFDAYLLGTKAYIARHEQKDLDAAVVEYTEAIRLDPNYALAFVARSMAIDEKRNFEGVTENDLMRAQADAENAIALAPDLGEGHGALARVLVSMLEFTRAAGEYERAVALAPGNAQVIRDYAAFAGAIGRLDAAISAGRRAVLLDPLNPDSHATLAGALYAARQYSDSIAAFQEVLILDPDYADQYSWAPSYALGKLQTVRAWCEGRPANWGSQVCLAITYDKLGRHADAEAQLAKFKSSSAAEDDWYQYAEIYAQWGYVSKALGCLERAMRQRHANPGLGILKFDPLLDPLRQEPRFQAIERELKFPD